MPEFFRIPILLVLFLLPAIAHAQEPSLPRVLIIGDSVYRQPASDAAKELKGRVEVVYKSIPTGEVLRTTTALDHLDELLGEGDWDVIYFNVGLGDLVHRVPGMKSFRLLPWTAGGVRATSPEQYDKNLREIVKRLESTGAQLVWGSTTPIRHSTSKVFQVGSEVEYNAIAAQVMSQHDVIINDMYSYVVELIDMDRPASHGADPFFFDRKPLHPPIVSAILSELDLQ